MAVKSTIKTFCKSIDLLVTQPVTAKVKEEANQKLSSLYKILDKSARKGIIKKKKAIRQKSQYANKVYSLDSDSKKKTTEENKVSSVDTNSSQDSNNNASDTLESTSAVNES